MRIIMVESPYSLPGRPAAEGRAEAIRYAQWCVLDSILRGEVPIASHLLYTQVLSETESGRDLGLKCRDELARRASTLVAQYIDLGVTPGMVRDVDCTNTVVQRTLTGLARRAWVAGETAPGSMWVTAGRGK